MTTPVTLITGASSGIGAALAREYASRGHALVLLGRRKDKLDAVARGGDALALACDVANEAEVLAAVRAALDRFGRLDVAIANAGISVEGPFEAIATADHRRVFETNYFGVVHTAKACFEALRDARGRFAATGSVSGFLCAPGLSPYNASKFALRGLLGTLEVEWARHGIAVTHVAPGFVKSEIRERDAKGRTVKDPVPAWLVMDAGKAAHEIADAIDARRAEVVITGHGKVAVQLARHTPRALATLFRATAKKAPTLRTKRA